MSRLVVPISGKTLWSTGDVRLLLDLDLLLKDNTGGWKKRTFRVDSGTDITTFPAHLARQLNLPLPVGVASGAVHTTGREIRSGLLRFDLSTPSRGNYHKTVTVEVMAVDQGPVTQLESGQNFPAAPRSQTPLGTCGRDSRTEYLERLHQTLQISATFES